MGNPKHLFSDEKSGFRAKVFCRCMNDTGIKHVQTSTHAPSVEKVYKNIER